MDARRMWRIVEPIHAVTYFTPEALAAFADAGLRGYWRGYFAGRAAPLGAVDAAPVIATFYQFAPSMVARAIPSVWSLAAPADVLAARASGADAALRRLFADVPEAHVTEAAEIAEHAVALLDPAGRTLGAANAALPVDPAASAYARLWQATATFREHRGDGHCAALLTMGFDGLGATIWRTSPGKTEQMQGFRGWTPEQWAAGVARLTERGFLHPDGTHAPAGTAAYDAAEEATDRNAGAVWDALGANATARLTSLLIPMAQAAYAALPTDNPVGLPTPPAA
jgi:hypothetical protein